MIVLGVTMRVLMILFSISVVHLRKLDPESL
jgi:hypothetical protein